MGVATNLVDLRGQRFGLLMVMKLTNKRYRRAAIWLCRCDCGAEVEVLSGKLREGVRRYCSWEKHRPKRAIRRRVRNELGQTFRQAHMLAYVSWLKMRRRCSSTARPEHAAYYRDRGITVCERWFNSFEAFFEDMGDRPPRHSLERIENDAGYEPGNCKWVLPLEQVLNRRVTVWVEFRGERIKLAELAARAGILRRVFAARLKRGWPIERAVGEPVRRALFRQRELP